IASAALGSLAGGVDVAMHARRAPPTTSAIVRITPLMVARSRSRGHLSLSVRTRMRSQRSCNLRQVDAAAGARYGHVVGKRPSPPVDGPGLTMNARAGRSTPSAPSSVDPPIVRTLRPPARNASRTVDSHDNCASVMGSRAGVPDTVAVANEGPATPLRISLTI